MNDLFVHFQIRNLLKSININASKAASKKLFKVCGGVPVCTSCFISLGSLFAVLARPGLLTNLEGNPENVFLGQQGVEHEVVGGAGKVFLERGVNTVTHGIWWRARV